MSKRYKVLITGSSGMLGTDLWQGLEVGYELYGTDLRMAPHDGSGTGVFIECDITDGKSINGVVSKIQPDIVVHTAAWTDVDGCETDKDKAYRINSEGTKNIALVCKESDAILIYISTDFVFDGRKAQPYKEEDKTHPISIYGDSKLKGEEFIKDNLKRYYIIRTSWLYGRHGKNFVDTILAKAKDEKLLKVVDDQTGSPTYTKDLAVALHVLVDKILQDKGFGAKGPGIYHISNNGAVSWYEYAKAILVITGSGTEIVPISSDELARPARRPAMSVMDNSKFYKETGYKMRDWKDALREYVDNYKRVICSKN